MSEFTPKRIDLSTINGGNRLENGSGYTPETFNAPIEASAFAQGLATNPPNVERANQVGTPSVTIELLPDGTPRLVFENLKGERGEQGIQGEQGSTELPNNLVTTDTAQTINANKTFGANKTLQFNRPENLQSNTRQGWTFKYIEQTSDGVMHLMGANGYYWVCDIRGNSTRPTYTTQTSTTDIALVTDILTQADYVTETWKSSDGLSWYRKWNSGLKEVMINITTSFGGTGTALKKEIALPDVGFSNANYIVLATPTVGSSVAVPISKTTDSTTTTLVISCSSAIPGASIYCCGY